MYPTKYTAGAGSTRPRNNQERRPEIHHLRLPRLFRPNDSTEGAALTREIIELSPRMEYKWLRQNHRSPRRHRAPRHPGARNEGRPPTVASLLVLGGRTSGRKLRMPVSFVVLGKRSATMSGQYAGSAGALVASASIPTRLHKGRLYASLSQISLLIVSSLADLTKPVWLYSSSSITSRAFSKPKPICSTRFTLPRPIHSPSIIRFQVPFSHQRNRTRPLLYHPILSNFLKANIIPNGITRSALPL